ncbi:MAG: response regulator [Gemmatimonadota bacterium]
MSSILIIDDDASVRRLLRKALEGAGHTVAEANNGGTGMQRFREKRSDLVITDLYMPEQDGIETIQQLRAEAPGCRILAVSGEAAARGTPGALRDAGLLGADAMLAKPFDIPQLLAAVEDLLKR